MWRTTGTLWQVWRGVDANVSEGQDATFRNQRVEVEYVYHQLKSIWIIAFEIDEAVTMIVTCWLCWSIEKYLRPWLEQLVRWWIISASQVKIQNSTSNFLCKIWLLTRIRIFSKYGYSTRHCLTTTHITGSLSSACTSWSFALVSAAFVAGWVRGWGSATRAGQVYQTPSLVLKPYYHVLKLD